MSIEYRVVIMCDDCGEDIETYCNDRHDDAVLTKGELDRSGAKCNVEVLGVGAVMEHLCQSCYDNFEEEGQLTGLTDEQVENWRAVLVQMIGPYALVMPKEEIIKYKERFQKLANEEGERLERLERNGM